MMKLESNGISFKTNFSKIKRTCCHLLHHYHSQPQPCNRPTFFLSINPIQKSEYEFQIIHLQSNARAMTAMTFILDIVIGSAFLQNLKDGLNIYFGSQLGGGG